MKSFTYKDFGFVCGLAEELHLIPFAFKACLGPGLAKARKAAEMLLQNRPLALISVGFAGGLNPGLKPGDLIIAQDVSGENGQHYLSDSTLMAALNFQLSAFKPLNLHIISCLKPVLKPKDKEKLAETADVIDMESLSVAEVAHQAGLPFATLRVILDSSSHSIPPAACCLKEDGSPDLPGIIAGVIKSPSQILPLLALIRPHNKARQSLAQVLEALKD